ncbi:hypothetical protein GCM10023336_11520 [Streptomyces similanensis]|uniref:DUF3263 domain-containing protein n=1 Tax=Streptomyces similanensis TaxID=1274988 RepID=A0ABP9JZ65_9ACTN
MRPAVRPVALSAAGVTVRGMDGRDVRDEDVRDGGAPDEGGGAEPSREQREREQREQGLGRRERDILALERRGFSGPGAKERAVREELGLSPVRYYQLLNALLDDTRALAHDPVTVNRLRRIRESRRSER